MTDKSLFKLISNEETVFHLPLDEFRNLFPPKLRSAMEVESLHNAISERKLGVFRTVKRNIKEYLKEQEKVTTFSDGEYVLHMLELLEKNLEKNFKVLLETEENLEHTIGAYFEYLEMQADELELQCQVTKESENCDQKSHFELLSFPS